MNIPQHLRVLIAKSDENFIAQCLEHDIAGQGDTADTALYDFERILVGHILLAAEEGIGLEDIPAAPTEYHQRFAEARDLNLPIPQFELPDTIPSDYRVPQQSVREWSR
jgi:hypothetical protein